MIKSVLKFAAITAAAVSMAACGQVVQPGHVGIIVNQYGGDKGVAPQAVQSGWNFTGPGTYIVEYPTTQRVYQWARSGDGDDKNINEEITFTDATGLPLSADVAVTMQVDPSRVPYLYKKYRLSFDQLRNGPIRTYARTAIAEEAAKYPSDQLYTAGRQKVVQSALVALQKRFGSDGIEITDLQWTGGIRFPASVQDAIKRKTEVEQETLVAQANVMKAEANAKARVAEAQGEADAKRILGSALQANPQVLQQEYLNKWDGHLPSVMAGGNTSMLMQLPARQ